MTLNRLSINSNLIIFSDMNNTKTYYFPYVRKGLSNCILEVDTLGESTSENGAIERSIIQITAKLGAAIASSEEDKKKKDNKESEPQKSEQVDLLQSKRVDLVGPGDVLSIGSHAVIKSVPTDMSTGFSKDYMPYVEFWEPDFLWRYTPAAPQTVETPNDVSGSSVSTKLRPWLSLIVCESSCCKLANGQDGHSTVALTIQDEETYAQIFISPNETWRMAHAQGCTPEEPDFCRLIATRRFDIKDKTPMPLKPDTEYTVMLIPTFETGRLKGLGMDCANVLAQKSAWENTLEQQKKEHANPLSFPVYYSWTYTTGDVSFDTLVQSLQVTKPEDSAIKVDVTHMGNGFDYTTLPKNQVPERKVMDMPATVRTLGQMPAVPFPDANDKNENCLRKRLEELLAKSPVFYDNVSQVSSLPACCLDYEKDDPWITPPVYGAKHAMAVSIDNRSNLRTPWIQQLNLDMQYRAVAGLGKRVVQMNQEEFVNRAWKQIDVVQELNRRLRMALASYKNNISTQSRMYEWMKGGSEHFIANLMQNLPSSKDMETSDGVSLSSILKDKGIPESFASASFQRISETMLHMDMTSMMENIARGQEFKFYYATPEHRVYVNQLINMGRIFYKAMIDYCFYQLFVSDEHPLSRFLYIKGNGAIENRTFVREQHIVETLKESDGTIKRSVKNRKPYTIISDQILDFYNYYCFKEAGAKKYVYDSDISSWELKSDYEAIQMYESMIRYQKSDGFKFSTFGYLKDKPSEGICVCGLHKDIYKKYFGDRKPVTLLGSKSVAQGTKNYVYFVSLQEDSIVSERKYHCYSYSNSDGTKELLLNKGTVYLDMGGYPSTMYVPLDRSYHMLCYANYKKKNKGNTIYKLRDNEWNRYGITPEKQKEYRSVQEEAKKALVEANSAIYIDSEALEKAGKIQVFETPAEYLNSCLKPILLKSLDAADCPFEFTGLIQLAKKFNSLSDLLENELRRKNAVKKPTVSVEKKVEQLRESFLSNPTYERVKEVASNYYKTFFSNKELVDYYMDELLSSKYPIMAYPIFPEPTYHYLNALSEKFILPCVNDLPENSVAAFESNSSFIEAYLCGMNTEMGEELLWREYPTDRRGSYFRKFWDSEMGTADILKENYFDVSPLHTWEGDLGSNMAEGKDALLIFAIKGKLMREFPDTQVYLHKANMNIRTTPGDRSAWFSNDKDAEMLPVMEAFLSEDVYLVGFKTTFAKALGVPPNKNGQSPNWGYMLTFKQRAEDLNFMPNKEEATLLEKAENSAKYADILIDKPTLYGIHLSHFLTF